MHRGLQNTVLAQVLGGVRLLLTVITVVLVILAFLRVGYREAVRIVGPDDSEAVELVLMHWSGGGGQEEDDIVQASIVEFEQRNPNIKVKRINPGDSGQYFTKLQTMMAAGEPPDIFYMDFARMAPFAEAGQLEELDDYFAAESEPDVEDPLVLDDFFTPAVDAFRLQNGKMGLGPLFGVPKDFTTVGIYWNRDLFDQANAQHPTPDWTWDDFVAAGRKVHALDGITGAELVTWPFVLRGYWSRGASVVMIKAISRRLFPRRIIGSGRRPSRLASAKMAFGQIGSGGSTRSLFLSAALAWWARLAAGWFPVTEASRTSHGICPLPRNRGLTSWPRLPGACRASRSIPKRHEAAEVADGEQSQPQSRLGLAIPTFICGQSEAFLNASMAPANDQGSWTRSIWPRAPWPMDPAFQINFSGPLTSRFGREAAWAPKWTSSPLGGPTASSRPSRQPALFLACLGVWWRCSLLGSLPASWCGNGSP